MATVPCSRQILQCPPLNVVLLLLVEAVVLAFLFWLGKLPADLGGYHYAYIILSTLVVALVLAYGVLPASRFGPPPPVAGQEAPKVGEARTKPKQPSGGGEG